jgi:nitroimidazol reductase NimA-like FMN-containing flavoprotein (pyridoxamine 5'-phosphate oxidase superfamily)
MRRAEFEVTDPQAVETVLSECDYGVVSLVSGGVPYGVAVNFAYRDGKLYFHGSPEGRKAEAIGARARGAFLAVRPYAFLPSYFSDTRAACPATQYFASVHLEGEIVRLDDPADKAAGLTALMEKMQPEGGYEAIHPANPIYTKMLEKTAVYRMQPAAVSLKVKAGQNLSEERREVLVEKLKKRNSHADGETLRAMGAQA